MNILHTFIYVSRAKVIVYIPIKMDSHFKFITLSKAIFHVTRLDSMAHRNNKGNMIIPILWILLHIDDNTGVECAPCDIAHNLLHAWSLKRYNRRKYIDALSINIFDE